MRVEYKTKKDLPCNELYKLFLAVGWAKAVSYPPLTLPPILRV